MEIRRISKFSKIILLDIETCLSTAIPSDKIIQIITDDVAERFVAIEYIPEEYLESYLLEGKKDIQPTDKEAPFDSQQRKTQEEIDLENALDTVLNNDPLGKYNGCLLREPFEKNDTNWIEWVLKNMHNKFIKDKVALIKESGYGR